MIKKAAFQQLNNFLKKQLFQWFWLDHGTETALLKTSAQTQTMAGFQVLFDLSAAFDAVADGAIHIWLENWAGRLSTGSNFRGQDLRL